MDNVTDEFGLATKRLAKDVVSEIVLSNEPERVIKKWRKIFKISQKGLANELGITSSVISDYESGRRKSPGIKMVKKYVNSLLLIDAKRGGDVIRSFAKSIESRPLSSAIIDIKEFSGGVDVNEFCKRINAGFVVRGEEDKDIYGYTIIDSLRAITDLSYSELVKLYGITTQRCLIFTGVSTGRTPIVAIKLTSLHPTLVVLHGLNSLDDVARRVAEVEKIPLAVCRLESVEDIMERLRGFG